LNYFVVVTVANVAAAAVVVGVAHAHCSMQLLRPGHDRIST